MLKYSPLLVMMKLGCYPNWKAKQKVFAHCYGGWTEARFQKACDDFATKNKDILRKEGIQTIRKAMEEGAEVVIVSASVEHWVKPFFKEIVSRGDGQMPCHFLCTKIEIENGKLTGRFLTENCYGNEKVNRLLEIFPDRKNYHLTAYGDSRGDSELLDFADEAYYKPFRKQS